jgi:alpha-1,2-mannosyltransferase
MAGLTTAIYGVDIWHSYLAQAVPFQNHVLEHGQGLMLAMMPTAFTNARLMGLPESIAWLLQAIVSLLALAAVVWTFWRRRDPLLSAASLLTASLLFTPYSFNYDMAGLILVLAKLRELPDNEPTDTRLIVAVWLLPAVMMLGFIPKVAGSVFVLLGFGARLIQRLQVTGPYQASAAPPVSAATLSMT